MILKSAFYILVATFLFGCGENLNHEDELIDTDRMSDEILRTTFDGKIFSIPSPAQTSLLIKNLEVPFNAALVNSNVDVSKYTTLHEQALNIGVLGANLGYAAMYDEKRIALDCYSRIYLLSSELNIQKAFDADIQEKYEKKRDLNSLLNEMTESYKETDDYLKNANKKDVSALILTGGWIQSMHLLTNLSNEGKNKGLVKRISEQKVSLNSLIEILSTYNKNGLNNGLISQLKELKILFDAIESKYYYNSPETNEVTSTTTLKHSVKVKAEPELILSITENINKIRNSITKL